MWHLNLCFGNCCRRYFKSKNSFKSSEGYGSHPGIAENIYTVDYYSQVTVVVHFRFPFQISSVLTEKSYLCCLTTKINNLAANI